MSRNPLESKIETYLKEQIKNIGGLCYKWKSTVNGVPDQIVIFKGNIHFIEVKRPGEKPRANQVHVHSQINKQDVPVYTVDTTEKVDEFIRKVLKTEPVVQKTEQTVSIKSMNMFKTD